MYIHFLFVHLLFSLSLCLEQIKVDSLEKITIHSDHPLFKPSYVSSSGKETHHDVHITDDFGKFYKLRYKTKIPEKFNVLYLDEIPMSSVECSITTNNIQITFDNAQTAEYYYKNITTEDTFISKHFIVASPRWKCHKQTHPVLSSTIGEIMHTKLNNITLTLTTSSASLMDILEHMELSLETNHVQKHVHAPIHSRHIDSRRLQMSNLLPVMLYGCNSSSTSGFELMSELQRPKSFFKRIPYELWNKIKESGKEIGHCLSDFLQCGSEIKDYAEDIFKSGTKEAISAVLSVWNDALKIVHALSDLVTTDDDKDAHVSPVEDYNIISNGFNLDTDGSVCNENIKLEDHVECHQCFFDFTLNYSWHFSYHDNKTGNAIFDEFAFNVSGNLRADAEIRSVKGSSFEASYKKYFPKNPINTHITIPIGPFRINLRIGGEFGVGADIPAKTNFGMQINGEVSAGLDVSYEIDFDGIDFDGIEDHDYGRISNAFVTDIKKQFYVKPIGPQLNVKSTATNAYNVHSSISLYVYFYDNTIRFGSFHLTVQPHLDIVNMKNDKSNPNYSQCTMLHTVSPQITAYVGAEIKIMGIKLFELDDTTIFTAPLQPKLIKNNDGPSWMKGNCVVWSDAAQSITNSNSDTDSNDEKRRLGATVLNDDSTHYEGIAYDHSLLKPRWHPNYKWGQNFTIWRANLSLLEESCPRKFNETVQLTPNTISTASPTSSPITKIPTVSPTLSSPTVAAPSEFAGCDGVFAELDLIFILDASGSMMDTNYPIDDPRYFANWQKEIDVCMAILNASFPDDTRIGAISFSGCGDSYDYDSCKNVGRLGGIMWGLHTYGSPNDLHAVYERFSQITNDDFIGYKSWVQEALRMATFEFNANSSADRSKMIIMFADNIISSEAHQPCIGSYASPEVLELREMGVLIIFIGIGHEQTNIDEYLKCVVKDYDKHFFEALDFDTLSTFVQPISNTFVVCSSDITLVINEVGLIPNYNNNTGQHLFFIELYNGGSSDVSLDGFRLSGMINYVLGSEHTIVHRDQYWVVSTYDMSTIDQTNKGCGGCDQDLLINPSYVDTTMNNTYWKLELYNLRNELIDSVEYIAAILPESFPEVEMGHTHELIREYFDNSFVTNWEPSCYLYGTPQKTNEEMCVTGTPSNAPTTAAPTLTTAAPTETTAAPTVETITRYHDVILPDSANIFVWSEENEGDYLMALYTVAKEMKIEDGFPNNTNISCSMTYLLVKDDNIYPTKDNIWQYEVALFANETHCDKDISLIYDEYNELYITFTLPSVMDAILLDPAFGTILLTDNTLLHCHSFLLQQNTHSYDLERENEYLTLLHKKYIIALMEYTEWSGDFHCEHPHRHYSDEIRITLDYMNVTDDNETHIDVYMTMIDGEYYGVGGGHISLDHTDIHLDLDIIGWFEMNDVYSWNISWDWNISETETDEFRMIGLINILEGGWVLYSGVFGEREGIECSGFIFHSYIDLSRLQFEDTFNGTDDINMSTTAANTTTTEAATTTIGATGTGAPFISTRDETIVDQTMSNTYERTVNVDIVKMFTNKSDNTGYIVVIVVFALIICALTTLLIYYIWFKEKKAAEMENDNLNATEMQKTVIM